MIMNKQYSMEVRFNQKKPPHSANAKSRSGCAVPDAHMAYIGRGREREIVGSKDIIFIYPWWGETIESRLAKETHTTVTA